LGVGNCLIKLNSVSPHQYLGNQVTIFWAENLCQK